jgi:ABC-type multidrug transport system ATPase subunit
MNSDLFAGPPIIVKGMGKVYKRCCKKKSVAVKDITFTVSSGHVFGLLGVNGAGKTTMFKMLTS